MLRLCGAPRWSWLAPSVGVAVLMLVAYPAVYLPGRAATTAVLLALLTAAAGAATLRDGPHRPPLTGILAAAPAALLALVPFAAAGQAGILGVSFNNDMAAHLLRAAAHGSESVNALFEPGDGYPIGPHALATAVSRVPGIGLEDAFTGLSVAAPVLLAWTALGALRHARLPGQALVATVAGMPYIVASHYGQGAFKEVLQATFVLAAAVALQRQADLQGRLRWIPLALLFAGALAVYGFLGMAWPLTLAGVWLAGVAVTHLRSGRSVGDVRALVRGRAVPVGLAAAALALVSIPQAPLIADFLATDVAGNATGEGALGNLVGPVSIWEAFGAWDNPDFRMYAIHTIQVGVLTAAVAALALIGCVWWARRGDWIVPAALAVCLLVRWFSDATQSPYTSSKALVMISPLLLLVAAGPLADRGGEGGGPRWTRIALPLVAAGLALTVIASSYEALRFARVGPLAHKEELRELRPLVDGGVTLFLGNDDFVRWELAPVPIVAPVIGRREMPIRPEKYWSAGEPLDVDSLVPAQLNKVEWVIAPRDTVGSAMPEELRLVRTTRHFGLWRRTAPIGPRSILAEGADGATGLDCATPAGRRLQRAGGVAAVRQSPVGSPVPPIPAGGAADVKLRLVPGEWELHAPYTSQHELRVTGAGLDATLPANLDRPGTRWRIGRIRVPAEAEVTIRFEVAKTRFTRREEAASVGHLFAAPAAPPRVVPLRDACGALVDWFRSP